MKRYSTRWSDYSHQAYAVPAAVLPTWNVTFLVTDLFGNVHEYECRNLHAANEPEARAAALRYAKLAYGTRSNPREFAAKRTA